MQSFSKLILNVQLFPESFFKRHDSSRLLEDCVFLSLLDILKLIYGLLEFLSLVIHIVLKLLDILVLLSPQLLFFVLQLGFHIGEILDSLLDFLSMLPLQVLRGITVLALESSKFLSILFLNAFDVFAVGLIFLFLLHSELQHITMVIVEHSFHLRITFF